MNRWNPGRCHAREPPLRARGCAVARAVARTRSAATTGTVASAWPVPRMRVSPDAM